MGEQLPLLGGIHPGADIPLGHQKEKNGGDHQEREGMSRHRNHPYQSLDI